MKCPCKNCKKREVGCHSYCNNYIKWSKYNRSKKEKERQQKHYDWVDNYYLPSRGGKSKIK